MGGDGDITDQNRRSKTPRARDIWLRPSKQPPAAGVAVAVLFCPIKAINQLMSAPTAEVSPATIIIDVTIFCNSMVQLEYRVSSRNI